MPSFADQIFYTTVRIETDTSCGTGFFLCYQAASRSCVYLVTNKHVIASNGGGGYLFLHQREGSGVKQGAACKIAFSSTEWSKMWSGHPDVEIDVAVCALDPLAAYLKVKWNLDIYFKCFLPNQIVNAEQEEELSHIEEVTLVGYPNGIWDQVNSLPIARRGITATPLQIDFEGQPKFLVDASVFGGSSGSPVIIMNENSYSTRQALMVMGSRVILLGIIAEAYFRQVDGRVYEAPIPTTHELRTYTDEMLDLGVVFKVRTISQTIDYALTLEHA